MVKYTQGYNSGTYISGVTNSCLIRLKAHLLWGNASLVYTPRQLCIAGDITDPKGALTITTLLYQYDW